MIGKKSLSVLLMAGVLAASASPAAFARGGGGNGLAVAAGILGAVAVGTVIANSAQPVYDAPPPRYYAPPPQPVYYAPPQYYQAPPQPVYVNAYPPDAYYYYHGGYYRR
jgi:hypothetical protein